MTSHVARADAGAAGLRRHQRPTAQLLGIASQRGRGDRRLLRSWETDQTHDAGMRLATHNRQLAKVLVESHYNLTRGAGTRQNGGIAGIGRPVSDAFDLVSDLSQRGGHGAGHATVDQDLHAPGLCTAGSTRS